MKKLSQKTADEFCNNEYCDQEIFPINWGD